MSRNRQRAHAPRLETLRRRGIKASAQNAALVAVDRITTARHITRGLDPCETGYADLAIRRLACPWPIIEEAA